MIPPEFRVPEDQVGDTGKVKTSYINRHRRAFALMSLVALGSGSAGGGYLGYKVGAESVRGSNNRHAKAALVLRSCVKDLAPLTDGDHATVDLSSLSEQTQEDCEVVGLNDSIEAVASSYAVRNVSIGHPEFDVEMTFDVGGLEYDAAVEESKSHDHGKAEKIVAAGFGAVGGFALTILGIAVVANPRAAGRAFKSFGDALAK